MKYFLQNLINLIIENYSVCMHYFYPIPEIDISKIISKKDLDFNLGLIEPQTNQQY